MTKLLIVEDNQQSCYLLQVLLTTHGFTVEAAANGAEALELAHRHPPEMIISDILMPVMDGFALCRAWKADERLQDIPFIFYTATYTDPQDEDFALRLGAARFIVKPSEPDDFLAMLREVIAIPQHGKDRTGSAPQEDDVVFYKEYNQALVRKLESKVLELKEENMKVQKSESFLRDVLRTTPSAVFTVDLDRIITSWNRMAEKITGYSAAEVLGKKCDVIESPTCGEGCRLFDDRVEKPGKYRECIIICKDGRELTTLKNFDLLSGSAEETKGGVESFIDITERKQLEGERQQATGRLRKALGGTIQALSTASEARDPYTSGHQRRVADLARAIAVEIGLASEQIDSLRMAGTIHDIGKISVPTEILSMPRKLTVLEFSLIKTHAQSGYEILKDIEFPWPIARMVLEHHEKMDGSGYPQGLTGDKLLLESRIIAVADVVEAMASHRPYRPGLGIDAALEEIAVNRGILYDAEIVAACLKLFRDGGYQLAS